MSENNVIVMGIAPFWRYAVGPTSQHSAAVPFYTQMGAQDFFRQAKRDLPWAGARLYKRRGIFGIEVVEEYKPE